MGNTSVLRETALIEAFNLKSAIEHLGIVLYMAVGKNQLYDFGVGAPPILVYFSGDWDVHWVNGDIDPWPYEEGHELLKKLKQTAKGSPERTPHDHAWISSLRYMTKNMEAAKDG